MKQLIWQDGYTVRAATWRGLERAAVLSSPWTPLRIRRRAWRKAMAHRARVWSNTRIPTVGSSRRFLERLEAAGLVRLEETAEKRVETPADWSDHGPLRGRRW